MCLEMKRCLNATGTARGNSEVGWIHIISNGFITFTYMFFCVLSTWETLDLSASLQISLHTNTGGWMVRGRTGENLVEWVEEERKSLIICQISNTQGGLNYCTSSSFHSIPNLALPC